MKRPFLRSTRRREDTRPLVALTSGLLVVALILAFTFVLGRAPREVPLLGYKTMYLSLPDSANLRIHSEVRARGVRLGEVTQVIAHQGRARVRLKLDPGAGEIPVDTTATVHNKGLLGSRYVELSLGRRTEHIPAGGTIRPSKEAATLSVTDALSTFDPDTRTALRHMLRGMGEGLAGRGPGLNEAIHLAPGDGRDFEVVTNSILTRPGAARALAPSLNGAVAAFDDASEDVARGLRPGTRSLRPFVDRREAVHALMDQAPPTLSAAQPALAEGRRLLAAARSFAGEANATLPSAPAGLRATTALLRDSPAALRRTRPLLVEARPAVPDLLRITGGLSPVLDPMKRALDDTTSLVTVLGRHGCDVVDFGDNWRSVLNQGIPGGTLIGPLTAFRVTLVAAPESVSGFGKPAGYVERDRYPAPCRYSVPAPSYGLSDTLPVKRRGRR